MSSQSENIKGKAIKGMMWSAIERFGTLAILFVSNIVLARLLTPEDYGLIGMLLIFITVSEIIVDGGFAAALIQKKDANDTDCSTIFFANIGISIICYLILFFSSDAISNFYHREELSLYLRILGVILLLNAFGTIQNTILVKSLDFKKITIIKTSVAAISSFIAIAAALMGMGVWSLVLQYLSNSFFRNLFLWLIAKWHPSFVFNKHSFTSLFSYGSKLLLASLISELYRNIQIIIIGRFFPARETGYFTQAKQLENVPTTASIAIVNQVTFPVFSQLQDSHDNLVNGIRRSIKTLAFINTPVMVLLAIIAKPLFIFLYTDKWLPAVPYFQWLCIGFGLLLVIHSTNLNALKAIGKSQIVLYLEIVKKVLGVILIFLFMKYGVIGILWALAINSFIEFFLNGYFTGYYLGYGAGRQLLDITPVLIISAICGGIVYYSTLSFMLPPLLLLVIQTIAYTLLFLLTVHICKVEAYSYFLKQIKKK